MNLVKVIQSTIDSGKRFIQVLRYGVDDVQTPVQVSPFGIDSNPVKDMVAVYSETNEKGRNVIIGYINTNQLSETGATRLYSTDSDGNEQTYIKLTNDGFIEVGGDTDFMVRFSELELAYNQLKDDHDSLADAFNQHMHPTAGTGAPSPPTPIPTLIPAMPSTGDISGAKIEEVKTI